MYNRTLITADAGIISYHLPIDGNYAHLSRPVIERAAHQRRVEARIAAHSRLAGIRVFPLAHRVIRLPQVQGVANSALEKHAQWTRRAGVLMQSSIGPLYTSGGTRQVFSLKDWGGKVSGILCDGQYCG